MENSFWNLDNFSDFVYVDAEFDTAPPPREWCDVGVPWWGACVGQAALLLILIIIYRLLRLCPSLNCPHPANILTLYINLSLWAWVVFLILALATCSLGVENPLVVTAIVFVSVFGLGSILDCFFGTEGWYLVDLRQMTDAIQQLEKIKTSPPVHRVHIECFHIETVTLFNSRGKFLTRSRKMVTYTDHRDFPYTSWSDISDWPVLETIATQGNVIIGISLERMVEPGDPPTRNAFNNFRNRFVQQNCHRDEQVRSWVTCEIPDLGREQSIFISTKPKEEMPFIFKIGFFLALSSLCLSCPLRTLIRKKTKLVPLKVRKVYFADPDKMPPPSPVMMGGTGLPPANGPSYYGQQPPPPGAGPLNTSYLQAGSHHQPGYKAGGGSPGTMLSNGPMPPPPNRPSPALGGSSAGGLAMQKQNNLVHREDPYPRHYPAKDAAMMDKSNLRSGGAYDPAYRDYGPAGDDKGYLGPPDPGRGLYLPGKDYYDESLYSQQRKTASAHNTPLSLHNNFGDSYYEEDDRGFGTVQTHPRVAMLKNTNIETEMRGRLGGDYREGRRVHYQERDYRRHQSPSPGPRDRSTLHPGHHRSRRMDGDEGWSEGYYPQHMTEEDVQYNA